MLVLSRKTNEAIVIDLRAFGLGLVKVTNIDVHGDRVRVGVEGNKNIPIHREEVFDRIETQGSKRAA